MPPMVLYPHDAGAIGGGLSAVRVTKANQACHSCRKQKRKCDKALPSCSLCSRMARFCDYSDVQRTPTNEDFELLQKKLKELEARLNTNAAGSNAAGSNASLGHSLHSGAISQSHTPQMPAQDLMWQGGTSMFDPTLFLDGHLFKSAGLMVSRPSPDLPTDILQWIGDTEMLQHILSDYFTNIHPWLPIVSRKLSMAVYPMWDGGTDIAALYLAMKLISSHPQKSYYAPDNYLYAAIKQYLSQLENIGTASLQYLQALILVALYEYGHGIYPAAWMTVAHCVRYADFVGLPSYKESNTVLGQCATWMDAEERRRTWWAVYIMDKVVSIGSQKRALCSEPAPNEVLPIDDKAWDTEDISLATHRSINSHTIESQAPFARLCQAALLAGKFLRQTQSVETSKLGTDDYECADARNLFDTARSLCVCLQAESMARPRMYFGLTAALCLTQSVLIKMLGLHSADSISRLTRSTPEMQGHRHQHGGSLTFPEEELSKHMKVLDDLRKTSLHVQKVADDLFACVALDEDLAKAPPLVLDALYAAAATFLGAWEDSAEGPAIVESGLDSTKKCLVRLSSRWRLSNAFLKLLDHHEINAVMMSQSRAGTAQLMPMVVPTMM